MTKEEIINECWEWIYWHSQEYVYVDEQNVRRFDSLSAANACKKYLKTNLKDYNNSKHLNKEIQDAIAFLAANGYTVTKN